MSTTAQLDELNRGVSDLRQATQARNPEAFARIAKAVAGRSTAIHNAVYDTAPTEDTSSFVAKHMGLHESAPDVPIAGREEDVAFQKWADDVYTVGAILGLIKVKKVGDGEITVVDPAVLSLQTYRASRRRFAKHIAEGNRVAKSCDGRDLVEKAMYATGAGVGDEWVPTQHSPRLYEAVRLASKIAPLFTKFSMPSNPWTNPVEGALPEFKLLSENTADTPTNITAVDPATKNVTFTAKKGGFRVVLSEEIKEDSIIAILPWLRKTLAEAAAHGLDQAIVDGDTTNPHQDSDVDASTKFRRAWLGLRKRALAAAQIDGSTFSTAKIRNVRAQMGNYGADPTKLAYLTSVSGAMRLMGLTEVKSVDVFGPQSPILTGQIAVVDGVPVIVSQDVRQDLNASGVYNGTTKTNTMVVIVNRDAFALGERRGITLKSFLDPRSDTEQVALTARWDFQPMFDASVEVLCGYVYAVANSG